MRGATAFVDRGRRTTRKCYNLYATVKMLTTRDGPAEIDAKAGYWPTIVLSAHPSIPPAFDAPFRELLLEYCHNVWCGETRLVWLPSDENNLTIRLCILTTHEPDIQTDGWTDGHCTAAYSVLMRQCILRYPSKNRIQCYVSLRLDLEILLWMPFLSHPSQLIPAWYFTCVWWNLPL